MLTFAEQLAQIVRMSGLTLEQFDELASYISCVSAMTGLSVEDVTQILQGASAHTGISMSDLAKTLEDLVLKEGGEEGMAIRYKELGNYKGKPVHEVSLNDYITLLLDREAKDDIYYVITENLSVVLNEWVIGRITSSRRNIGEVKHINVRSVFGSEIDKRVPRAVGNKMNRETLISARPTVALFVREGENKLKEQARRGRELVEALRGRS